MIFCEYFTLILSLSDKVIKKWNVIIRKICVGKVAVRAKNNLNNDESVLQQN